jgi:hypothetical protein
VPDQIDFPHCAGGQIDSIAFGKGVVGSNEQIFIANMFMRKLQIDPFDGTFHRPNTD